MVPRAEQVDRWTDADLGVKIGENFFKVLTDEPLGTWEIASSFDSATACEVATTKLLQSLKESSSNVLEIPNESDAHLRLKTLQITESKCIASDDPRLAK